MISTTRLYIMRLKADVGISLPEFVITDKSEGYSWNYKIHKSVEVDRRAVREFVGLEGDYKQIMEKIGGVTERHKACLDAAEKMLAGLG